MQIEEFKDLIEKSLLPNIDLKADSPFDPILVRNYSASWKLLGNGNYAAVFVHSSRPEWVVKVYGRNQEELKKEIQVYQKLGSHPSYSFLYGYGKNYLILKRIDGITLFNALVKGVPIPESVIKEIDTALKDAKTKGLNPYDVHGKNVAMNGGRGYIVDISDFYKKGYCSKWDDLKKAYYRIYKPFIFKFHPPFPFAIVDSIRKGYRLYKKVKRKKYC
ncbi:serine/threonine protein kinase [Peribacillus deserti]|uniref:Serine/threonine protein kinase n=1 Tax=Peribacillus deserti TaxID=673318 RepID=A0ABS2QIX8_9BACI|nr:serine/threonine protein kinase [Peribacillus deserti]MBM7693097.1 serine/threonine protein kinase [Peribacillus deserti]